MLFGYTGHPIQGRAGIAVAKAMILFEIVLSE
jgi:hypothetical protein